MPKIAVIGATGAVGREIIRDLEDCHIDNLEVIAIASPKSAGKLVKFRNQELTVKAWELALIDGCDYVLMSAGAKFSLENAPAIAAQGAIVIDNSSAWREEKDIPLIVPEVNGNLLSPAAKGYIIANPNCAAIQLVISVAPLLKTLAADMLIVSTYQSVSGKGQSAITQLQEESHQYLQSENITELSLAFNIHSAIGPIDEKGDCEEENKIIAETKKILQDHSFDILATCTRVPVFNCHSESVAVRINKELSLNEITEHLSSFPGVKVCTEEMPTLAQIKSDKRVWVSRIRKKKFGSSSWLQFWSVADNLKKGAASNTVQIFTSLYDKSN
jgi:aspartate-semialdehyde dehydrogenase